VRGEKRKRRPENRIQVERTQTFTHGEMSISHTREKKNMWYEMCICAAFSSFWEIQSARTGKEE
jgi:hypothetical protein